MSTATDARVRARPVHAYARNRRGGRSRKLLLATGVGDNLPDIHGIHELYGRSVFHCPYCDGWEVRDPPIAIYGRASEARPLAGAHRLEPRFVLCTDGPSEIAGRDRAARTQRHRRVRRARAGSKDATASWSGSSSPGGEPLAAARALLHHRPVSAIRSGDPLGCEFNEKGTVHTGKYETTHLRGLFVAGDASRAVQWVIVAAAEGAEAAFAINTDLTKENLK